MIFQFRKHRSFPFGLLAVWMVFILANGAPAEAMQEPQPCAANAAARSHHAKMKGCCCHPSANPCECELERSGPASKADVLPLTSSSFQRPLDGNGVLIQSPVDPSASFHDPQPLDGRGVSPPGPLVDICLRTLTLLI